jgi:hypothetical protein
LADDKHYVPGDYYQIDDIRGYKVRKSRTRTQWDGIVTIPESFSPRQPQDLVVGVPDFQSVEQPRPRQANNYTIVETYLTAGSHSQATSLTVASVQGFNVGDLCQVSLDNGNVFQFTLALISGLTLSWLTPGLPSPAGVVFTSNMQNTVTDLSSVGGT